MAGGARTATSYKSAPEREISGFGLPPARLAYQTPPKIKPVDGDKATTRGVVLKGGRSPRVTRSPICWRQWEEERIWSTPRHGTI